MGKHTDKITKNQSGQTMVEFVLLISVIAIISLLFKQVINQNISKRWEKIANVILDDPTQTITIR